MIDQDIILADLINEMNLKIGIEIGVRHGWFSYWLLSKTNLEKLYSIDWEYNDIAKIMLGQHEERSIYYTATSPDEAEKFQDGFFDFIYIDADHSYEQVYRDLVAWWPKLKIGGLFSGDDYVDLIHLDAKPYGVIAAVDKFADENNLKISLVGNVTNNKEHCKLVTEELIKARNKQPYNKELASQRAWYCVKE